jgi:hypothetical protein
MAQVTVAMVFLQVLPLQQQLGQVVGLGLRVLLVKVAVARRALLEQQTRGAVGADGLPPAAVVSRVNLVVKA